MIDERDDRITTDRNGDSWLTDELGDKIPPTRSKPNTSSGFTTYDTHQGHCGLCGRISCSGGCFK